jgi:hypothetical protein
MIIRLSPNSVFWAALDPTDIGYLGGDDSSTKKPGNQEFQLILNERQEGEVFIHDPVEVDLNTIPWWAKEQILSSIEDGTLVKETVDDTVIAKEEDEDFGALSQTTSQLKKFIKEQTSSELLEDLLAKEKRGLNQTRIPRAGVIATLEEKIKLLNK